MRPWTTRTLNAVVVAAGFAAVGTGTASAADATTPAMPDLTQVPDEIGFTAPLDTCSNPGNVPGREKMPCADTTLQASVPNLFKEVGKEIATTAHGVAGELRDDEPVLASGEPNRLLGHVTQAVAGVERMTESRPTVAAEVDPGHTGLLSEHGDSSALLDAEVGPREPDHQGVSTLDTAVDATLAQGYTIKPLTDPVGSVETVLREAPQQKSANPVTLPDKKVVLPADKQVPALATLDNDATDVVRETAGDLLVPHLPTNTGRSGLPGDNLPVVGNLPVGETLPVGDVVQTLPLN